jgi:hypothetical protein
VGSTLMPEPRRGGRRSPASPEVHVLPPLRGSGRIGHLLPAAQAAGNLLSPPWGWLIGVREALATENRLARRHSRLRPPRRGFRPHLCPHLEGAPC